jgi:LysM repeat protein
MLTHTRLAVAGTLMLVVLGMSACYKDAGDNVEPTSNRVNLSDLEPTTLAPSTPLITATPTVEAPPAATPTRTLVPTTTPFDTEGAAVDDEPVVDATNTPVQLAPTFTPASAVTTPQELGIETPGMSDILPSFTPAPTVNPSLQPTTTPIPPEENPCVHVVQPGDTLYSIATNAAVEVSALVAANPSLLGGSELTPLQIGWQLEIPGCAPPGQAPPADDTSIDTDSGDGTPGQAIDLTPPSGGTTHTVQPGETIYSIARQYSVEPQAIITANNLVNPDRINVGDVLIIPASN